MSEEQAEYLIDALEMIGSGYAAVEIEHPRTVIQRREGRLRSVDKPAFIKLSTNFKSELAGISGDALKVWIFISLSINRKSERANPGLRTIADGVGLAVNTVQKALKELEAVNLLAVNRGKRRYNLYEVPEYVSANKADPTVSNRDTDSETVSNPSETVSNSAQTVSPSVILNQSNQNNQNGAGAPVFSLPEPTPTKKQGDLVDGWLALSQSPGIKRQARIDAILSVLAERLHVLTTGKRWEEFAKLVDDRQQNFGEKLDVFLDWLTNQKGFNPQFWPPDRMGQFWPQAFVNNGRPKAGGRSLPEIG